MIKLIDYGLGNILAFQNMYKRLNIPVSVAQTTDDLTGATKLILPGVGAFDHAIKQLNSSGMRQCLEKLVLVNGIPVLGICVGMQMLAECSDEGQQPGLGWIPGKVKSFKSLHLPNLMLPHMGWNDVCPLPGNPLFDGLQEGAPFYFLHSYYFECTNVVDVAALSVYGKSFSSAVSHESIYGVQFHPEKSHSSGAQLLKNFASI